MSLTVTLDNAAATPTQHYASDGRGSSTTTEADSLLGETDVSYLVGANVSGGLVRVYHQGDTVAGTPGTLAVVFDSSQGPPYDCGPGGIELEGKWYVELSAATMEVTLIFQRND